MMHRSLMIPTATLAIAAGIAACSSSDSSTGGGTGGLGASAGSAGMAGAAQGGNAGSGGNAATGGNAGSGGSSATGGSGGNAGAAGDSGAAGTGGIQQDGGKGDAPMETGGDAPFEAGSGACTNPADFGIISSSTGVDSMIQDCALKNLGAEPATKNCIKQQTGLSDGCVECFDGAVVCGKQNCMTQCLGNQGSQACTDCREQYCNASFTACSGLPAK